MRSPVNQGLRFCAAALGFAVASCAPLPDAPLAPYDGEAAADPRATATGPQADYPVVTGEPFTIDGISYTPVDTMNYDEVGYATIDDPSAQGVTAAHRTLPLPSYVEVTSLDTGRTILVRVERRGPMVNSRLVALSRNALAQLAAGEGTPVRVRRVNPPEEHRAELRAHREAPARMDTPEGLLAVLKRKLPVVGSAPLHSPAAGTATISADEGGQDQSAPTGEAPPSIYVDEEIISASQIESSSTPLPTEPKADDAIDRDGRFVVQAGAFSSREAAERVASTIGGYLEPAGRLWRVRTGPYATRGQAQAALAKVRGAGYRGAQIFTR